MYLHHNLHLETISLPTSGTTRHSKLCLASYCKVVPPGEFNVTIHVALLTYYESFTMTAVTVNHSLATLQTLLLSPQLFAVAAALKSIDYNVAMTFILNNNNNN